jgi:hypothetical protein
VNFHRHRWGPWRYEYEEMPDGDMGTYEIRTRECKGRGCDYYEEAMRCVSLSPEVVHGLTR